MKLSNNIIKKLFLYLYRELNDLKDNFAFMNR